MRFIVDTYFLQFSAFVCPVEYFFKINYVSTTDYGFTACNHDTFSGYVYTAADAPERSTGGEGGQELLVEKSMWLLTDPTNELRGCARAHL